MRPEPPADPLAARAQVELDLLRAAATRRRPPRRAEALARAGRWLADAAKELSAAGADPALVRRLTDLAAEVARATGAVPELWARVEATLVELASGNTAAPKPARRAFWKR